MWLESSSVNAVNLAKNYYNSRDIEFFLGDYFFGAPCTPHYDSQLHKYSVYRFILCTGNK